MFLKNSTSAVAATACSDALIWARLRPLRANFGLAIFSSTPRSLPNRYAVIMTTRGLVSQASQKVSHDWTHYRTRQSTKVSQGPVHWLTGWLTDWFD